MINWRCFIDTGMNYLKPKSTYQSWESSNSYAGSNIVGNSRNNANCDSSTDDSNKRFSHSNFKFAKECTKNISYNNTSSESKVDIKWALHSSVNIVGCSIWEKNTSKRKSCKYESSSNHANKYWMPRSMLRDFPFFTVNYDWSDESEKSSKNINIVSTVIIKSRRRCWSFVEIDILGYFIW